MSGFNTDVRARGERYHVQTQMTRAGAETLVYMGGQVVYARRMPNVDEDHARKQHERVVASVEDASLDLFAGDDSGGGSLAESVNGGAASGDGLLRRLSDFVHRQRKGRRQPPAFSIDTRALRRIAADGSGSVTARLAFATGKPVAGVSVAVERFQLLGPSTHIVEATTDDDGSLTFDCELGDVRPVGLMLRSEWDGDETTARFLV